MLPLRGRHGREGRALASSELVRWGRLAAMVGCAVWAVEGLLILALPQTAWTDVLFVIAILLTVAGLVDFHALQKDDYGRIGRGGLWTVVATTLAQLVGLAVFLSGSPALELLVFPVGTPVVLICFVLYEAATLRAGVLPHWCGIGIKVARFPAAAERGVLLRRARVGGIPSRGCHPPPRSAAANFH